MTTPTFASRESPPAISAPRTATVVGAYGHTGQFVVAELHRRGWTTILAGRDPEKLEALRVAYPGAAVRQVDMADPRSLDRAIAGADVVIHCAGPFADTTGPVLDAALRARVHYLDTAAEQPAVVAAFERCAAAARDAGIVAVPAMAFYGGLGDLLATAAMADWRDADAIDIAIALDRWYPTRGTRLTGQRQTGPRLRLANHHLGHAELPAPRSWEFGAPFGRQAVEGVSLAEAVLIARHLRTAELRVYLNAAPLRDLRDPATPPPAAVDDRGRSAQIFEVEVIAHRGGEVRRVAARGRDIYAISAPLVVEGAARLVAGSVRRTGVLAAGEAFDAGELLAALAPELVTAARS